MPEQNLPIPVGYRLLVKMYVTPDKIGGIYRPDAAKALEDTASICAQVIDMGQSAYKDPDKFEVGAPWAKIGDWVVIRAYSGTRLKVTGEEYRLINDDMVEAVIIDPGTVEKV